MDHQQEYQQELQKVQDRDFSQNWVSSSAFIFYLSVFCLLAFSFGSCFKLYNKRYDKTRIESTVQPSTQYTPQYK
jgi:lipopolysaccharide export LptBFGC system permease protein LptF